MLCGCRLPVPACSSCHICAYGLGPTAQCIAPNSPGIGLFFANCGCRNVFIALCRLAQTCWSTMGKERRGLRWGIGSMSVTIDKGHKARARVCVFCQRFSCYRQPTTPTERSAPLLIYTNVLQGEDAASDGSPCSYGHCELKDVTVGLPAGFLRDRQAGGG